MILAHPTGLATGTNSVQIVGQFDRSCHRSDMIGGAGYVLYAGESRVISCRAVALPLCLDNVEAEILACLFLVEELCEVARQITSGRQFPQSRHSGWYLTSCEVLPVRRTSPTTRYDKSTGANPHPSKSSHPSCTLPVSIKGRQPCCRQSGRTSLEFLQGPFPQKSSHIQAGSWTDFYQTSISGFSLAGRRLPNPVS